MTRNSAFWKAFNSLTHPLSIGAVSLVLLNDHLFRIYAPSWWTGKLGDFAWLIFAPLICALIFAWLIPRRLPDHKAWVAGSSFGFIGIWFALAKTVPTVQHATNTALSAIIGWQTSLRLDPTDLFTLPALYIGWWVWQRAPDTAPNMRPYSWLVVGMGIFATLATSPGYDFYDYGVICVFSENENVYAWGDVYAGGFASSDGGLSWAEINADSPVGQQVACQRNLRPITWQLNAGSLLFSFTDRTSIDVSTDNGETWQQEWDFSFLTDERRKLYFDHFDPTFTGKYSVGPFDAVFDEANQHLIVAMGHDGVLVGQMA
ncbi:MAG: hypothetical protein RLP44_24280 [Aggregatilineales bacterium]